MKALTLWQPWASLVAHGLKTYETRSWATNYRGPLAIHAGLRREMPDDMDWSVLPAALKLDIERGTLPRGAVVALARLVGCYECGPRIGGAFVPPSAEEDYGDFSPGRYAWALEDVRPLTTPVALRGARKLWDLPTVAVKLCVARTEVQTQPALSTPRRSWPRRA